MVVFSHVVEQGSFSGAAKHIGLSRAVVSYHIKKLEQQLGIVLLNRSTRSIALTQAGSDYYQRCRIIAQQASAANQQIENVKNEPEGLLKITCPVSVGLHTIVPALDKFRHMYPKIELDIMLTDEVVNIVKEGIDLAIRGAPLSDSGLQARKLAVLSTCICGSPGYFKQHGRPNKPSELNQHNWIVYKLASNKLALEKSGRTYKVDIKGTITTNNATARTAFVEGGHGLGRIPIYDAWPKIKAGLLQTVLDDYQLKAIDVYGVFPPGSATSKKLRLLIDFLEQFFDQQQASLLTQHP